MPKLTLDPNKWKIKLPMFPPQEVSDNSTNQEYARCPRRGLYRYGLRRGFQGKSWPIQFGLAYHKYRETVEHLMMDQQCSMNDEIHQEGINKACEGWEEPPIGHRKEFLNMHRLYKTVNLARTRIEEEQRTGKVVITRAEDSFDLELGLYWCPACFTMDYKVEETEQGEYLCYSCGGVNLASIRHGGRIDAMLRYPALNNANMVRDFKTTSYRDKNRHEKYDPHGALQGYTWAGGELSGREFDGALIEEIYNTKTQGPEITQQYVTYSTGQQEQWLASIMMERQFINTMWARVDELGYLAFPQRTSACGDFGGCGFREACRAGSGWELENWLESYTIYSEWDFTDPEKEESAV